MAQIQPPTWRMRGLCPVCEQGSSLAFMACPLCARLVILCEEEGSVFLDPKSLLPLPGVDGSNALCPGCRQRRIAEFAPASDVTIRAQGFTAADYE